MPYATNLNEQARPRGLGDLADAAASFGTWVVDMRWGLSPKHIHGQTRPYGPPVVTTFYPRSQDPRLLNLHQGPVVAGGTWPQLAPVGSWPGVFRTPMVSPGSRQMSMPPLGMSGFGYVPMGVATTPYHLLAPGEDMASPYEQMPAALRGPDLQGFGADDDVSLTVGGKTLTLTAADTEWVRANATRLQNAFYGFAQSYVAARSQLQRFQDLYADLAIVEPDATKRRAQAEEVVFGAVGMKPTQDLVSALDGARVQLASMVTSDELAQWPAPLRDSWLAFVGASSAPAMSGYGADPVGLTALLISAGVAPWLAALAVGVLVIGLVLGVVALVGGLIWKYLIDASAQTSAAATASNAESLAREREMRWQLLTELKNKLDTASTQGEREMYYNMWATLVGAQQRAQQRDDANKAQERAAGGGGVQLWHVAVFGTIAAVFMAWMRWRVPGQRRSSGGGSASVASMRSATTSTGTPTRGALGSAVRRVIGSRSS